VGWKIACNYLDYCHLATGGSPAMTWSASKDSDLCGMRPLFQSRLMLDMERKNVFTSSDLVCLQGQRRMWDEAPISITPKARHGAQGCSVRQEDYLHDS